MAVFFLGKGATTEDSGHGGTVDGDGVELRIKTARQAVMNYLLFFHKRAPPSSLEH